MKPRQTEYDAWMRFQKAIQPPSSDDDEAFDKFVSCHFRIQMVDPHGICGYPTVLAEVRTEAIHAELFNRFDDFCADNMEAIRGDYGDEYDYSDPDDRGDPEIIYTGGNIYCGLIRVDDGWFYGELNGWGGIWKTREQAIECIPNEEEGLVRIIENLDEQIGIMTRIYLAALSSDSAEVRCDLTDDDIKTLMRDMVSDIKSWNE